MKGQICPRCGKNILTGRDALSRHKNISICSECGQDEALRDWRGEPLPYSKWAVNLEKEMEK